MNITSEFVNSRTRAQFPKRKEWMMGILAVWKERRNCAEEEGTLRRILAGAMGGLRSFRSCHSLARHNSLPMNIPQYHYQRTNNLCSFGTISPLSAWICLVAKHLHRWTIATLLVVRSTPSLCAHQVSTTPKCAEGPSSFPLSKNLL